MNYHVSHSRQEFSPIEWKSKFPREDWGDPNLKKIHLSNYLIKNTTLQFSYEKKKKKKI